jgi:hypothetical protein
LLGVVFHDAAFRFFEAGDAVAASRTIRSEGPELERQAAEPGLPACGELTRVVAKALEENSGGHDSNIIPRRASVNRDGDDGYEKALSGARAWAPQFIS